MHIIWKYKIEVGSNQSILLPFNYKILTLQAQQNTLYIWVCFDKSFENEIDKNRIKVVFDVFATGETIDDNYKRDYIGTFQLNGGFHVFHLFKRL